MINPFSRLRERWGMRQRNGSVLPRNPAPRAGIIDAICLEDRTLFSANPIAELANSNGDDAGVLAPVIEEIPDQIIAEDTSTSLLLTVSDPDTPIESLTLSATTDNSELIQLEHITWRPLGEAFRVDLAPVENQFGQAEITFSVSDGTNTTTESFGLHVKPTNDRPTSVGFDELGIQDFGDRIEIDLFAAFEDVESADEDLVFSIDSTTGGNLADSIKIDSERGVLVIDKADGASGTMDLLVRATDEDGKSILLGGIKDPITVYEEIVGVDKSEAAAIGLEPITLITGYGFFEYVDGAYKFDTFIESKLRYALNDERYISNDSPVVLDIENSFYVNTPAGRDRWAEVLKVAHDERPDLDIGVYSFLPERSWFAPISHHRSQDDLERNVNTGFLSYAEQHETGYVKWLQRNNEFRSAETNVDAMKLGEHLDTVHPSLYTFYIENRVAAWQDVSANSNDSTFSSDTSFVGVNAVRIKASVGGRLPTGLSTSAYYYVVNEDEFNFQLSATPGGEAISFGDDQRGELFITEVGTGLNRNILDWHVYAEENIAEARKLGRPVNAWLSPSKEGVAQEHMDYDFFKLQLETVAPLVDEITIFNLAGQIPHADSEWWAALTDFMAEQRAAVRPLELTIENTNSDPVATGERIDTLEGWTLTGSVLSNDTDADGDELSAQLVVAPEFASTFELNPDGTFRYEHDGSEQPTDSFTYQVSDGRGGSDTAAVDLHFLPINDAPKLDAPETLAVEQGQNVVLNEIQIHDPDSESLLVTVAAQNGTLSLTKLDGLELQADAVANSAITIQGSVSSMNSAITIRGSVPSLNSALTSLQFEGGAGFSGSAEVSVMVFDHELVEQASIAIDVLPDKTLALDEVDKAASESIATARVQENQLLTIRDVRLDGDQKELIEVELQVQNGTFSIRLVQGLKFIEGDGQDDAIVRIKGSRDSINQALSHIVYRSNLDFHGSDNLMIREIDGVGQRESVVKIDVVAGGDSPHAVGPALQEVDNDGEIVFSAANRNAVTIDNILGRTVEITLSVADGELTLADTSEIEITHGTGRGDESVTFRGSEDAIHAAMDGMSYRSEPGFAGQTSLRILVLEVDRVTSMRAGTQSIQILVAESNAAPIAENMRFETSTGTALTGSFLNHISDADGDNLTVEIITRPTNGSIAVGGDGAFTYRPQPGFVGTDQLTYRVRDGELPSELATMTFEVLAEVSSDVTASLTESLTDASSVWRFTRQSRSDDSASSFDAAVDAHTSVDSNSDDETINVNEAFTKLLTSFYLS